MGSLEQPHYTDAVSVASEVTTETQESGLTLDLTVYPCEWNGLESRLSFRDQRSQTYRMPRVPLTQAYIVETV